MYNVDSGKAVGPYWRITQRVAPHNEYTSTQGLRSYASSHGGSTTGSRTTLPHKGDVSAGNRPRHFTLTVQFSSFDYSVTWRYDPASNEYLRFMGGAPHVDAATGAQLRAKNVVVMFTDESSAYDPFTPGAIHMRTEGTGQATVYEDGTTVPGTWSKPSVNDSLQWLDRNGRPIPVNKGTTWVEVVPTGSAVTAS